MAMHGDDAAALLAQTAAGPAVVAGASIGALIGLHLAVQHPALVATLIEHEPPIAALVPDAEQEAELDKVAELARDDVVAAIQHMGALTSGGQAETEEGAQPGKPVGDLVVNLRRFFTSDFDAVRESTLDSTQIAAVPQSTFADLGTPRRAGLVQWAASPC
jgi:pimeloyl-ACP methyl ester carboxylesterase